ncbi:hypothetical protein DFJ77DRAFT_507491 [Powellomyces hirtus]|nr:hypothetical protein DFJ77DRAFT_507491 [Powellomyces hirtus]
MSAVRACSPSVLLKPRHYANTSTVSDTPGAAAPVTDIDRIKGSATKQDATEAEADFLDTAHKQDTTHNLSEGGPRPNVDGLFSATSKIDAFEKFRSMNEAGELKDWSATDYQRFVSEMAKGPVKDGRMFLYIHDTMLRNHVRILQRTASDLMSIYADVDAKMAVTFFRASERMDVLRKVPENQRDDKTKSLMSRLQTEVYKSSNKDFIRKAESLAQEMLKSDERGTWFINYLFRMLGNRQDIAAVERWIQIVGDSSVQPTAMTYALIIRAYGRTGDQYNAQKWFENYLQANIAHVEPVYTAFAEALGRAGRVSAAREVLEKTMIEHKVAPTTSTYTTLMELLIENGEASEAKEVLLRMETDANTPKPDFRTYDMVFERAVARKEFPFATYVFSKLLLDPKFQSSHTLSAYGQLCIEHGKVDDAVSVYNLCYDKNGFPDPSFTDALLKTLDSVKNKSAMIDLFEKAFFHFEPSRRVRDNNFERLIPAVTRVAEGNMALLLKLQQVTNQLRIFGLRGQPREMLLREYDAQGGQLQLTASNYSLLFETLFTFLGPILGQPHIPTMHKYIFRFLEDMLAKDLKVTRAISDIVLRELERRRMIPALNQWKEKMAELGIKTPEISAEHRDVLTPIKQAAMEQEMLNFCQNAQTKEAMEIFHALAEKSRLPRSYTVETMIRLCGRALDFDTVTTILETTVRLSSEMPDEARLAYQDCAARATFNAYIQCGWLEEAYTIMTKTSAAWNRNPFREREYNQFFDCAQRKVKLTAKGVEMVSSAFAHYQQLLSTRARRNFSETSQIYRRVMRVMQKAQRSEEVLKIWKEMVAKKIALDTEDTYDVIVSLGSAGDVKGAEAVFEHYVEEHWANMDIVVLNAMMASYTLAGKTGEAYRVYQIAENRKLPLTTETYEMVISGLARDKNQIGKALSIKQKMADMAFRIPESVYKALVQGACDASPKDLALVEELMNDAAARGVLPSVELLEIVIEAFASEQNMNVARHYRSLLKQHRLPPTTHIENAMISGYLVMNDFVAANNLFESTPITLRDEKTYSLIIPAAAAAGRTALANTYLEEMKSRNGISKVKVAELEKILKST